LRFPSHAKLETAPAEFPCFSFVSKSISLSRPLSDRGVALSRLQNPIHPAAPLHQQFRLPNRHHTQQLPHHLSLLKSSIDRSSSSSGAAMHSYLALIIASVIAGIAAAANSTQTINPSSVPLSTRSKDLRPVENASFRASADI
jgi:hypothetical protein